MSRYVVLEGGDGCGKSSQARALCDWLGRQGRQVLHVREPGSTPTGEALRELLLAEETGELRPITEALLFSAARGELIARVIAPALAAGTVVVAERCYLSTLVYQGHAGDGSLDLAWLRDVTQRVHGEHMPDRIFVLDVPAGVAAQRRTRRPAADRFEARGEEYLDRVRRGFLRAGEEDRRVRIVDASGSFAAVHESLCRHTAELLA
ncbi:MAG: dTMP kinase [Planctomycetes bacterium]|nr:dTMP kinase [Planctomycetota bacterium]